MKYRNGFVSNSSSSSFIVKDNKEKEYAIKENLKLYKVSDIIELLKPLEKIVEILEKYKDDIFEENLPWWLNEVIPYNNIDLYEYEKLKEFEEKYPNCYVTGAVDNNREIFLEEIEL